MISVTVFKTSILVYNYFYTQNIGGFYVCSNSGYDKGSPAKLILLFAVPLMLGNIFQQLYTMVDSIVVGQVAEYRLLPSLGAVEWIMWMVLGVSTGVTQGFSILISQHYGARKWNDLKKLSLTVICLLPLLRFLFCCQPACSQMDPAAF